MVGLSVLVMFWAAFTSLRGDFLFPLRRLPVEGKALVSDAASHDALHDASGELCRVSWSP